MIECLRGKAARFYGRLLLRDRDNFGGLRLEGRYGIKDPPHTLRHQLQLIKQFIEEDLECFAERVQQLAYDAYPEVQDRTENEMNRAWGNEADLPHIAPDVAGCDIIKRWCQSYYKCSSFLF